jgi:hypothetical protein
VSSHFATADVWIGNLDGEEEAEAVRDIIDDALSGAGYQVTVTVTAHPYPETDGGETS